MASAALGIGVSVISNSNESKGSKVSMESALTESVSSSPFWPDLFPVHENVSMRPAKNTINNLFIYRDKTLSILIVLSNFGKITNIFRYKYQRKDFFLFLLCIYLKK